MLVNSASECYINVEKAKQAFRGAVVSEKSTVLNHSLIIKHPISKDEKKH